jgi:hypothetical protein
LIVPIAMGVIVTYILGYRGWYKNIYYKNAWLFINNLISLRRLWNLGFVFGQNLYL